MAVSSGLGFVGVLPGRVQHAPADRLCPGRADSKGCGPFTVNTREAAICDRAAGKVWKANPSPLPPSPKRRGGERPRPSSPLWASGRGPGGGVLLARLHGAAPVVGQEV